MTLSIAKAALVSSTLLACVAVMPAHAEDCEHTARRTANSAGPDIKRVVIEARAGDLTVRGGAGSAVAVDGKACASTSGLLEDVQLEVRREGDTVYVRTLIPEISGIVIGSRYAYLDVTVNVPKTATLKIDDTSGDMHVNDVKSADITDSSGDQALERIAGDVQIADSSGEIKITEVGGSLRLKDSSGDVDVQTVGGNFTVGSDGSGGIRYDRVTGSVRIPD